MRVTIGDLDYYYNENKVNCQNPDVMKISSYHKQLGDRVNFVTTKDDIYRPYELYYIIKEKQKTPLPPVDFFMNKKVRWWGKAFKVRINGKMPDEMLICRPDYLLYPEKNTKIERSEYVRLFNNQGHLLPLTQDGTNTFTNKFTIIADELFWDADKKDLVCALQILQKCKNISFLHPIKIQKILSDEEIKVEFLKLKFVRGSQLDGTVIGLDLIDAAGNLMDELKSCNKGLTLNSVTIDYMTSGRTHGEDKTVAIEDFKCIKSLICRAKKECFKIDIKMPTTRLETPYFFIFEELSTGTKKYIQKSGLEYITMRFGRTNFSSETYWNNPNLWSELFRDLLRQTGDDREFLLSTGDGEQILEMNIGGKIGEKEFKYGI